MNKLGAEANRGTRGGSWLDYAGVCWARSRYSSAPGDWGSFLGLRLVRKI